MYDAPARAGTGGGGSTVTGSPVAAIRSAAPIRSAAALLRWGAMPCPIYLLKTHAFQGQFVHSFCISIENSNASQIPRAARHLFLNRSASLFNAIFLWKASFLKAPGNTKAVYIRNVSQTQDVVGVACAFIQDRLMWVYFDAHPCMSLCIHPCAACETACNHAQSFRGCPWKSSCGENYH